MGPGYTRYQAAINGIGFVGSIDRNEFAVFSEIVNSLSPYVRSLPRVQFDFGRYVNPRIAHLPRISFRREC